MHSPMQRKYAAESANGARRQGKGTEIFVRREGIVVKYLNRLLGGSFQDVRIFFDTYEAAAFDNHSSYFLTVPEKEGSRIICTTR